MLRGLILVFALTSCFKTLSQSLTGVILEEGSGIPLEGAHIYIINSLQGTISNKNGKFALSSPDSYGELLITYVGYQNIKIGFSPNETYFEIKLAPVTNQLEEVSVRASEDKKWKKRYKKFEASFLGSTENSKQCKIENPWVVDVYKGENGELRAKAFEPIKIINNALGYKLTFHLVDFSLKGGRLHYQGDVYFDMLYHNSTAEENKWGKNRKKTFLGSKRHFLMALDSNKLIENGFEIYDSEFSQGIGFISKSTAKDQLQLVRKGVLIVPDYLKVVYKNALPQRAFLASYQTQSSVDFKGPKADLVPKGTMSMSTESVNSQVSYLYSRSSKLSFTQNGLLLNSKNIIEYGYWSWLGVAEMMPYEYKVK